MPVTVGEFDRVEPILEQSEGWNEDITGARRLEDLPTQARAYVTRIEELTGGPVGIVSVGPGRDQTIFLHDFS